MCKTTATTFLALMLSVTAPASSAAAQSPPTFQPDQRPTGSPAWPDLAIDSGRHAEHDHGPYSLSDRYAPSSGPAFASRYSGLADVGYPGQLVSHPGSSINVLQAPGEIGLPEAMEVPEGEGKPDIPRDARPGVFQKLSFDGTWIGNGGLNEIGFSTLSLSSVFAFPCPTRESPLIITPGFGVHYLDGPGGVRDLPPQLFDAYARIRWMHRFNSKWAADIAVTPGVYSDFEQDSNDGIRITGHGVGAWTCNPELKLILGVAYLDRRDVGVLPAGGILWTPRDDLRFELVAPRPRIAKRLFFTYDDDIEDWVYMAGEFGGGTWAIARTSGARDEVTYRDFRFILGAQRKVIGGIDSRIEAGYVFGRKLEYRSATPNLYPSDTFMLRAGVTY